MFIIRDFLNGKEAVISETDEKISRLLTRVITETTEKSKKNVKT